MPIKGTLKEGELRIARIAIDFLKQPMQFEVSAALTNPEVGDTFAWIPTGGVVWSPETREALQGLVHALERDIASFAMGGRGSPAAAAPAPSGGIGENLGTVAGDAPQM